MKLLYIVFLLIVASTQAATAQGKHTKHQLKAIRYPPYVWEFEPYPIPIDSVSKHVFSIVTIKAAKVYGYHMEKECTLIYLGADYPHPLLTLRSRFRETRRLVPRLIGKVISVTGRIDTDRMDDIKPEMILREPDMLKILSPTQ